MMDFDTAFNRLLGFEGGYSNDAADPGGKTRFGITEAEARRHGYEGDMKSLPLETAKAIYRPSYWDACKCDELPEAIRYAVFDAAVNSGVGGWKPFRSVILESGATAVSSMPLILP